MQTVTLHDIKATQDQLAKMIATLEAQQQAAPTSYVVAEATIALAAGERYAGLVLKPDGSPGHHLILLPGEADGLTWQAANDWAAKVGGELPTRQEQALLYANLKAEFKPEWYWSAEVYETDGSYAWYQYFYHGNQYVTRKDGRLQARAVRRFTA